MKCPRCSQPTAARGPVEIAPYSGTVERIDACPCGWWQHVVLGWADALPGLQLSLFSSGVLAEQEAA